MPLVPPPGPSATSATASIAADSNIETRPSQATKRLIPRSESARVGAVPAPREWRPTSSLLTVSSQVQRNTGTQVRIPSHTRNLLGRTWSIAHFTSRTMSVPATCPSGGAIADSRGHSRATRHRSRRSANPQVTAMQRHRLPKLTVQALVRSGFRSRYAGGSVGVLPRTRRRRICDSRNLSRPSVAAGQPHRESCVVHVHAKTALTEPVRHQVRQLSDSGEGIWAGQGVVPLPVKVRCW